MIKPVLPELNASIIKVVGACYIAETDVRLFVSAGFNTMELIDVNGNATEDEKRDLILKTQIFYRDKYYRDFNEIMNLGGNENSVTALIRKKPIKFEIIGANDGDSHAIIDVISESCELYRFRDGITIFALSLDTSNMNLGVVSEITRHLRNFACKIVYKQSKYNLSDFISSVFLCNIKLRGENALIDSFSGSKFKIYSVLNFDNEFKDWEYEDIKMLAFEIGTGISAGGIKENHFLKPADSYYDLIMADSIAVFDNYFGLPLKDSLTFVGHNLYKKDIYTHHTYDRVYFKIYVYSLYIKYSINRFSTILYNNPIAVFDEFQDFSNNYVFGFISFDFLPNIISEKIFSSLNIRTEMDILEKRIVSLSQRIRDKHNRVVALLLAVISILTGLGAIKDFVEVMDIVSAGIGFSKYQLTTGLLGIFFLSLVFIYVKNRKNVKWFLFK